MRSNVFQIQSKDGSEIWFVYSDNETTARNALVSHNAAQNTVNTPNTITTINLHNKYRDPAQYICQPIKHKIDSCGNAIVDFSKQSITLTLKKDIPAQAP